MPVTPAPLPSDFATSNEVLQAVLDASQTAIQVWRPLHGPNGAQPVDFAQEYLNPAGQRLLGLAPGEPVSLLAQYPKARTNGVFEFFCRSLETGEAGHFDSATYLHNGADHPLRLAARCSGPRLVVSLEPLPAPADPAAAPAGPDREEVQRLRQQLTATTEGLMATSAELHGQNAELRNSQKKLLRLNKTLEARVDERAREAQAAHARAEVLHRRLERLVTEAPAAICILAGPELVYELVNPSYQRLYPGRQLLGRTVAEAVPEASGPELTAMRRRVYETGETFTEAGRCVTLAGPDGTPEERWFNFSYQARFNELDQVDGLYVFAFEVTAQVRASQLVQRLNEELEVRVADRTRELAQAQAETERQRQRLESFFLQAPVAICVHDGPELTYELVNPVYEQFFPDRPLLGRALLDAVPELAGQPAWHTLRRVYATGEAEQEHDVLVSLTNADGVLEDRYFTYTFQARRDEQGRIDGVLVFAFETTAQVQAEEQAYALEAALRATERRQTEERASLYQVFEQTPAAISILVGPEHRFKYCNPAYLRLLPDRQLLGCPIADVVPETVAGGFVALLDNVYHTGETYFGHEVPFTFEVTPGVPGYTSYFTFTYQAYREAGKIVGISVLAHDVTEKVLARPPQPAA